MSRNTYLSAKEFLKRYNSGERAFEQVDIARNESLQGADLSGIVLRHVRLHEVNLMDTNLEGSLLQDVTIEYARLQRARLSHTIFHRGIIQFSNLEESNLEGATFQGTVLLETALQNAILCWAQFHEADLSKSNLEGADLRGAGLSRTDVRGANLSRVLIHNTNIRTMIRDASTRWEPIDASGSKARKLMNQQKHVQLSFTGTFPLPTPEEDTILIPGQPDRLPISIARTRVHHMLKERFYHSSRSRQTRFCTALLQAYARQCAVTGCQLEGTLEAAHIIPYCLSRNCDFWNGLLLRSDLHRLFDLHLMHIDPMTTTIHFEQSVLTIDPSYQVWEGHTVQPPQTSLSCSLNPYERPWKNALSWRRDHYYQLVNGFLL